MYCANARRMKKRPDQRSHQLLGPTVKIAFRSVISTLFSPEKHLSSPSPATVCMCLFCRRVAAMTHRHEPKKQPLNNKKTVFQPALKSHKPSPKRLLPRNKALRARIQAGPVLVHHIEINRSVILRRSTGLHSRRNVPGVRQKSIPAALLLLSSGRLV